MRRRSPVRSSIAVLVVAMAGMTLIIDAGAASSASPTQQGGFHDRFVRRGPFRIHVRDRAGADPAIVLMHGFPDNHHLYDRLVPHLAGRHVVTFDFLGWGERSEEHTSELQSRGHLVCRLL